MIFFICLLDGNGNKIKINKSASYGEKKRSSEKVGSDRNVFSNRTRFAVMPGV